MKKSGGAGGRLGLVAMLVLSGLLVALAGGVSRVAGSDTADISFLRGSVSVLEARGPADTSPHPVWVWHPSEPDSATIPVLYYLHGYPGAPSDPFSAGIGETLNHLLSQGYPPFVFASVDGNGERHSDTEWANSWDGNEEVMSRVIDAVIPAVEGAHMRDAAHRAIVGFSMGGYGAMNIAMRNPGVFGQEVSLAGYFVVNDLSDMFGNRRADITLNTPSAHPGAARGMRVLLDEDASDPFPLIQGQAAWMGRLLSKAGVSVRVHIQPGGHDWAYAREALTYSFGFLYDGWRAAAAGEEFRPGARGRPASLSAGTGGRGA